MTRRGLLAFLASLPIVGRLALKAQPTRAIVPWTRRHGMSSGNELKQWMDMVGCLPPGTYTVNRSPDWDKGGRMVFFDGHGDAWETESPRA